MHKDSLTNYKSTLLFGITIILGCSVVLLGAWTRLSEAGLGCPDWPGCYGQLSVPITTTALAKAQLLYPNIPVEADKAWPEMIHRYFAGTFALLIAFISLTRIIKFIKNRKQPIPVLPICLPIVILSQAALGMWTVTLKLHPLVVMGHLLGGMLAVSLVWTLWLTESSKGWIQQFRSQYCSKPLFWLMRIALVIVPIQIALGGWTSSNYASLICSGLPDCLGNGTTVSLDFTQGFNFLHPIGPDYTGGVMHAAARMAIHMSHRYGAIIVSTLIIAIIVNIIHGKNNHHLKKYAAVLGLILGGQIALGLLNVYYMLPLTIAVMHNGGALLLLLAIIFGVIATTNRAEN